MNAPVHPKAAPHVTRTGRKFDQVLAGAREVFLQEGFEGASVDMIARAAGVSKATLYAYFPDKRLLFLEVAKAECQRQETDALCEIDFSARPEVVLRAAARRMVGFLLSEIGRGVFRICVAERERFPELGQEFYRHGPQRVRQNLVDYFRQAIAREELAIDDLELAADQFAELCKADMWPRLLMGVADTVTPQERERVIAGAVSLFLARYGKG